MNSAVCLTTLLAAVCLSSAASPEYEAKLLSSMTSCATEHKVDPKEIVQIFKANKLPETQEQKCVGGCIMMKMGYITDMTVDWAKVKTANPQKYETPELVAKADQAADACAKVVTEKASDICDIALPSWKCLRDEAEKLQLPKPEIKYKE